MRRNHKGVSILVALMMLPISFFPNLVFSQSAKVNIINGYGVGSLDTVLMQKEFTGKVVYIDIWGVHCIPCIEEFAFNEPLKNRFSNKEVAFLYLSLDYDHKDDNELWRKMIQAKNLVGYNMFISAKFYMNIWNSIRDSVNKKDMYLIPHYIIADRTGKIAFADAARPSSQDILYNQIEAVLQKKD
jgi:thiol-disulfide isomerase/thioredoxin